MARKEDSTATRVAVRDITITLTQGETRFTPVDYNAFSVGPFSATITIRKGEDVNEAIADANAILRDATRESYKRNLEAYCKGLSYNDRAVREFMESK